MSKNSDLKATIKSLVEQVQLGSKSGTEVAQSVNLWLKEGGEALKVKIEDEVERSVSKMGFVKRGEFEALKQQVADLKKSGKEKGSTKNSSSKNTAAEKSVKKSSGNKVKGDSKAKSSDGKSSTSSTKKDSTKKRGSKLSSENKSSKKVSK